MQYIPTRLNKTTNLSLSFLLAFFGTFDLAEAKEDSENSKNKKSHTLGKVTTQAQRIFNYNNQTHVSIKELERRQANQISDMFRRNPNINVGGGSLMAQKIYVRGIEDRLARVTVDGAAQMGASYGHQGNTIIDPGMLKEVIVTKGAAQASAGPMALIGAIKMETKSARDFIPKGKNYAISGATSFYTNFGDRENITGAYQNEHFDILLYYTHQNIFYYRDGNNAMKNLFNPTENDKVSGSPSEQNNVLVKANAYLSDRDTLTLSYNLTRDNAKRPLRANFTGTFLPYSCDDFNDYNKRGEVGKCLFENDARLFKTDSVNMVNNISLAYEREGGTNFNDPKLKIDAYGSVRNVKINPLFSPNDIAKTISYTAPNAQNDDSNLCIAQGGIYNATTQTCSISFRNLGGGSVVAKKDLNIINAGANVNVAHTLNHNSENLFEYGLNYQNLTTFDKAIPKSELVKPGDSPNACKQVTGPNDPNLTNGHCQRNGETANVIGVYAQANYTFHPMVTWGAGTRYDVYTFVDKDWQLHVTQGFSPSTALIISPLKNLNFRLSYAYVTRGPLPVGLVWMRQDNLRYDKHLKPEIGQNFEFNIEYNSEYFDFRAAGFTQLISNYINKFTSTLYVTNIKDIIYIPGYEVSGTGKYKGFSLGLSVGRSWPSLKGHMIADAYELAATTGNTFILTASYNISRIGLSFTWLSRFVTTLDYCAYNMYRNGPTDIDRQPSNCAKKPGIFHVHKPGYGISSFFVTYKPTQKKYQGLSVNLVFNNIFNKQYINQASPVMSPDEPNQDKYARGMAEPGFNARFEVAYKF
ncbi:TonB-dependent receptor domain-containing protein [Helicobacter cetorum]|uniref:TonB-dependent receptor domain-containing protein n=1 Tax=Helicobacter cetorum TaxID=138563 RepID=UPI000CF0ED66|nr:TonB-dependent receptor [Helicobacter cetorum]